MTIVDSHCHLFYDEIYQNIDEKIKNARKNGVKYFLSVATDEKSIEPNIKIAEQHKGVCCSVGIHPHHSTEKYSINFIKSMLNNKKVVAIGEVGLDYHYTDGSPKKDQIRLFEEMLSISQDFPEMPYIIHARECYPDILDILSGYKDIMAVFHCYTDSIENAKKILDMGYFLSFSGAITFKNAQNIRDVAMLAPIDRIFVETDCPYLSPVPFRGKTNEPAHTILVADFLAKLRGISLETIANKTTENFFKFFKKARFLLEENQ